MNKELILKLIHHYECCIAEYEQTCDFMRIMLYNCDAGCCYCALKSFNEEIYGNELFLWSFNYPDMTMGVEVNLSRLNFRLNKLKEIYEKVDKPDVLFGFTDATNEWMRQQ